jgi:hypothetical protein
MNLGQARRLHKLYAKAGGPLSLGDFRLLATRQARSK